MSDRINSPHQTTEQGLGTVRFLIHRKALAWDGSWEALGGFRDFVVSGRVGVGSPILVALVAVIINSQSLSPLHGGLNTEPLVEIRDVEVPWQCLKALENENLHDIPV